MNRTFSYSEEIFCSCFHSQSNEFSLAQYKSKQRKPFMNARQNIISASSSLRQLFTKKCSPKKSLKRQYQNNSLKINETKTKKSNFKITHLESIKIQGCSQIQNKQNNNQPLNNAILPNQLINLTTIKQQGIGTQHNHKRERKSYFFKKPYLSIQNTETFSSEQVQYQQILAKTKEFPKKYQPTEDESQPRTIKKTHMRKPSTFQIPFGIKQTENHNIFELRKKNSQQTNPGRKRISLKIQIPSQFDQIFQFKQIQSFQSSITDQSQVIEAGRFTWAPDGQTKQQGVKFISSLHIRDTSRASKLSSNRPSKMLQLPSHT